MTMIYCSVTVVIKTRLYYSTFFCSCFHVMSCHIICLNMKWFFDEYLSIHLSIKCTVMRRLTITATISTTIVIRKVNV